MTPLFLVRPLASATSASSSASSTLPNLGEHPWRILGPADMVEIRRPGVAALRALAPGTTVCLVLDAPGSRSRLRRIAHRAGLLIDRELIVLPSTTSPVVVLDDAAVPVARLWQDVATVPPGVVLGWFAGTVAIRAALFLPWQWTGALAPGRVLIGRMQ